MNATEINLITRRREIVAVIDYWANEFPGIRQPTDDEIRQAEIDLRAFDAAHPEIIEALKATRNVARTNETKNTGDRPMNATTTYTHRIAVTREQGGSLSVVGRTERFDPSMYNPSDIEIEGELKGWGEWTHIARIYDGGASSRLYFVR